MESHKIPWFQSTKQSRIAHLGSSDLGSKNKAPHATQGLYRPSFHMIYPNKRMQKVHVFVFFPSKCPSHACQVSLLCFLCFHSGLCCLLPRKRGRGCVRCLPGLGFGCGRGFIFGSIQGKLFLGLLSTLLVQDEVRTVGS